MRKSSLFIILPFVTLLSCKSKPNPADAVQSIRFKFTELGRETQFRIPCDKFSYYFPASRIKIFTKPTAIDSVMHLLDGMKPAGEGVQPDVRGQILITHVGNAIDTVCVGVKALEYKGATYETPQELLVLIQK